MILSATGHRPNKLGGYNSYAADKLYEVAFEYLKTQTEVDSIISGMALGWDTAWALAGLNLGIPLIAAVPFVGQERRWPSGNRMQYNGILFKAVQVVIVCEGGYTAEKMQERNEWMVDNSDILVALWDGSAGGTGNCVRYARKFNKPIVNLWDQYVH